MGAGMGIRRLVLAGGIVMWEVANIIAGLWVLTFMIGFGWLSFLDSLLHEDDRTPAEERIMESAAITTGITGLAALLFWAATG